jgi:hypothetical protein
MPDNPAWREAALDLCGEAEECFYTVKLGCMAPGIPAGARVRVIKCGVDELSPGDVVLLRGEGELLLHRFLARWDSYIICKADRRRRPDKPWLKEALIGKAVEAVDGRGEKLSAGNFLARGSYRLLGFAAGVAYGCGLLAGLKGGKALPPPDLPCKGRNDVIYLKSCGEVWKISLPAGEAIDNPLEDVKPTAVFDAELQVIRTDKIQPAREEWQLASVEMQAISLSEKQGLLALGAKPNLRLGLETFFRLAAMRRAVAQGGVFLHASSVLTETGGYIFHGSSTTGKTTSAETFGDRKRDDDFVLLLPDAAGGWKRASWNPFVGGEEFAVTALIRPRRGEGFNLEKVAGGEAVRECLYLPPVSLPVAAQESQLAGVAKITADIPCYRLAWRKGDDLPGFLGGEIG